MNNFGANPSDLSIHSNKNRGKPKVSILHYSLFNIHSSLLGLSRSDKPKFESRYTKCNERVYGVEIGYMVTSSTFIDKL